MSTETKAVVLFSGGVDSFLQLLLVADEGPVVPIFIATFDEHRSMVDAEVAEELVDWVRESSPERARNVSPLQRQVMAIAAPSGPNAFVPYRNFRFALEALASAAETPGVVEKLYIAGIQDDRVNDKTPAAFAAFTSLLAQMGETTVVESSLFEMSKGEVVGALLARVPEEVIGKTVSCYSATVKRCNKCKSCVRRAVGIVAGYGSKVRAQFGVAEEKLPELTAELLRPRMETLGLSGESFACPVFADYVAEFSQQAPEGMEKRAKEVRFAQACSKHLLA